MATDNQSLIELIRDLQTVSWEIGYKDGQAAQMTTFSSLGLSDKIAKRHEIRGKIENILGGDKKL